MSKVYSNDDLIPEKRLPKSVVALEDRVFQRFIADTQFLQDTNADTKQLEGPLDKPIRFKCRIADPGVVFKMIQIETVWRFTFRDRSGQKVSHDNIALVPEALIERAFKSVRVSLNGQNFLSIPLEKIHCEIANPILGVFPKDNGSFLPFRENSLRGYSFERNEGFETRARWFAEHKVQCEVADNVVASDVATKAGIDYLNVRVCFPVDCHALSSYQRGQEANMNTSIPFVYDMEICLFPNLDKSPGDYESTIKNDGTPFLKRIFRIGNPIAKVVLDQDQEFLAVAEASVPIHQHVVTFQVQAGVGISGGGAIDLSPTAISGKRTDMKHLFMAEQSMYTYQTDEHQARGITVFIGTGADGIPVGATLCRTITRMQNPFTIHWDLGHVAAMGGDIADNVWVTVVGTCLCPRYYFRGGETVSFQADGVSHLDNPVYTLKGVSRQHSGTVRNLGITSDILFQARPRASHADPLADYADPENHMFKNAGNLGDADNLLVAEWLCTQKGKDDIRNISLSRGSSADAIPRFNSGPITAVHGEGMISVRVKDSSKFTSGGLAKLRLGGVKTVWTAVTDQGNYDEIAQTVANSTKKEDIDFNHLYTVVATESGYDGDICLLSTKKLFQGGYLFDNKGAQGDDRHQDHFGGNSVFVTPATYHSEAENPIVSIDGRLTEEPTLLVEAITARDLKDSYILDDFRNDVYKIEFGTKNEVNGNKIGQIIRFDNLRLTEMPTKLYLFCKLRDEFCTTELMTSGISDMHLFMDQIEIRYMDKLVTQKNDQNLYWLYRTWMTLNPGSNLDYEAWRRYRFTLCLSPNEFCYPTFRSHVRRLGNIAISFVPRFTDVWKRFDKFLNSSHNYLAESDARKVVTPGYSEKREPNAADIAARQKFLDDRVWEAQLVLVYNNKAIRMDSQGGMSRIENFSDTIEPNSGFKTSDAAALAQGGKNNVVQRPLDAWAM